MHKLISKLVLYRNSPLLKLAEVLKTREVKITDEVTLSNLINKEVYRIIDLISFCRFDDDLWTGYITYILATNENPFTLSVERKSEPNSPLKGFALNDFEIFIKLMNYDFSDIDNELGANTFKLLRNYRCDSNKDNLSYDHNLSKRIKELYTAIKDVKDVNEFYERVVSFYSKYGVGDFGIHKAFRITSYKHHELITPIVGTSNITFSDLIGYEEQKKALIQNTEAFINGRPANNVLLYGDVGTGKSSSIKSLLNMYYEKGLRMIEIYKYDYQYFPEIISIIKNRNYRFIIYLDDLSFEKNETEYKYLKAVIEGGLEVKPENVLVYATSNRVHLFHETFSDRKEVENDDVHVSDTLAEHTSLASRFGLTVGYFDVKRSEYFDMVCEIAKRYKELSTMSRDELVKKANLWNKYHNNFSGRAAQQFIDDLITKV